MTGSDLIRLHAVIEGRVQGVGFRYFVVDEAERLGINGWVRNRWDDTVEVSAEAPRKDLEKFLVALRRGPTSAFVTQVNEEWLPSTGDFKRFGILPTL